MRIIIPALCASLALAGCQTTIGSFDEAIRKNLAAACDMVETAHQTFLGLIALYPLSSAVVATEAKAHADAKAYCDHPEQANTMSAVAAVARLAATIIAASPRATP